MQAVLTIAEQSDNLMAWVRSQRFSLELFWFGVIGVLALLVHWGLVSLALVPLLDLPPLLANAVGFLVAFQVSYWGHRVKTFRVRALPHRLTMPRFFGVAALSFVLNQGLYYLLLTYSSVNYRIALLLVLLVVAGVTFVLSKYWAFGLL